MEPAAGVKYFIRFETACCKILIAGTQKAITHLYLQLSDDTARRHISEGWVEDVDGQIGLLQDAGVQVKEYFTGTRRSFSIPLDPQGTSFQKRVWQQLRLIPYGEVRSYREIAQCIGNEKASRAVGMANNKNPIPILIPCHRVIGSNGSLVGFASGVDLKRRLLTHENKEFK
jgi:methylated-DNA-[protein]-cysteine S-methyltransferase